MGTFLSSKARHHSASQLLKPLDLPGLAKPAPPANPEIFIVFCHLQKERPSSDYTNAQYRSAAAQVLLWQARYGIPQSARNMATKLKNCSTTQQKARSFGPNPFYGRHFSG